MWNVRVKAGFLLCFQNNTGNQWGTQFFMSGKSKRRPKNETMEKALFCSLHKADVLEMRIIKLLASLSLGVAP